MSKEWASKEGLNPVLYLRPGSKLSETICSLVVGLFKDSKDEDLVDGLAKPIAEFLRYIKPYDGDFVRKGQPPRTVRFYDEREWRYVPSLDLTDNLFSLSEVEYLNPVQKAHADTQLEKAKLGFEPSDIRYLIVREDTEIQAMVRALRNIKAKYPQETIEILTSRIMTCEQIVQDV